MVAIKPDAVLVLGDTNSCLSVIGAKRLHIPIFHMEAGNCCKDECLPEETNRRIVDIILDVNMAYSEHARRYLADCGIPKERTCVTGSPNISKPGITKGEHWHHTKWELFIVVSGHGLIQLRKERTSEVLNYEVSRDKIQSVIMLPGYTHNIINLSDTDELITVMYCNEIFNPEKPDTFFDKVVKE
jgi:UDP-2-acetamido-2,6-beta-L-arabino-hexul-4-ose reductase